MARTILLDTGVLGMVTHPAPNRDTTKWFQKELRRSAVFIPDICDYELRRELLRAGKRKGLARLDQLRETLPTVAVSFEVLKQAGEFWATARRAGAPTAPDAALDADVILAAQAWVLRQTGKEVFIATTNVGHLSRFVPAATWQNLDATD